MAMQSKSEPGYLRVKNQIPYHGKGVDELIGALRRILAENKFTQKIVLEVGKPHIYIEKLVPEGTAEAGEQESVSLSIHDVIRNRELEEYESDGTLKPHEQLWEIFDMIHKDGFEVCNIVAGNKTAFQKWLGFRIPQVGMRVFGIPFEVVGDLPPDVFIVCGAKSRTADPDEITYCVKGTI